MLPSIRKNMQFEIEGTAEEDKKYTVNIKEKKIKLLKTSMTPTYQVI